MTVALGRIAAVNPTVPEFSNEADRPVTFVPLECVWPDGRADFTRSRPANEVSTGYTLFRRGDVLVPKITPTFEAGRVAVADIPTEVGAGTTELHIVRPRSGVDARFLAYVLRSQPFLQDGATRLQGVGNLRRVPAEFLEKFPVAISDPPQQRAIADYLDRETAQIDTLIEEQRGLLGLLDERSQAVIDEAFEPATANPTRVLRLLRHRPSYGVLKPDYVDAESGSVSLIRVGDILRLHERPQLPQISSKQSAEYARTELLGGEVVLGVVGKLGQAAVIPRDMTPANTNRPVAVLRCRNEVPAELLALWFRTTEFHRQAADATAGDSIQPTLGMRDLSSFTVNWPARPAEALDGLRQELSSIANLADSASQCIALTQERRAALITAAVTGQIDVGSAA